MNCINKIRTKENFEIVTKGLPNLNNDIIYHFNASYNDGIWLVSVPGNYIGRDQIGYPTFAEQVTLLNSFKTESYVYEGCWAFQSPAELERFAEALQSFQI